MWYAAALEEGWLAERYTLLRCHLPVRLDVFNIKVRSPQAPRALQRRASRRPCRAAGKAAVGAHPGSLAASRPHWACCIPSRLPAIHIRVGGVETGPSAPAGPPITAAALR